MSHDCRDDFATRILGYLCAAILGVLVTLMCIQVLGRFLLTDSPHWTDELARASFVYLTFFGGALAVARNGHLVVDVFTTLMGERLRAAVNLIGCVLAIVLMAIVAWQGYLMVARLSSQPMVYLPLPKGLAFAGLPLGAGLILIYEIRLFFILIKQLRTRQYEPALTHAEAQTDIHSKASEK